MSVQPKLADAASRMRIVDVVLKSINASLLDDFDPAVVSDSADVSFQTRFPLCKKIKSYEGGGAEIGKRRTVFEMDAALRVLQPKEEGYSNVSPEELESLVCASVECRFLVSFDEEPLDGVYLDDESLGVFAQHNVPFNMWPYWREIVQSACGRMGLPRIILPVHRLQKSAAKKEE